MAVDAPLSRLTHEQHGVDKLLVRCQPDPVVAEQPILAALDLAAEDGDSERAGEAEVGGEELGGPDELVEANEAVAGVNDHLLLAGPHVHPCDVGEEAGADDRSDELDMPVPRARVHQEGLERRSTPLGVIGSHGLQRGEGRKVEEDRRHGREERMARGIRKRDEGEGEGEE
eukprot:750627-Hanusia_phi.AAC.11